MKKIVSIVGARPQFIKLAPFSKAVRQHFNEVIIHTGQHYDSVMSQQFFKELEIPDPDHNLGIKALGHALQTGQMLMALEETLIKEDPHVVVVFGDTNSTLAGALSAAKLNIPVVHVEAGLRSSNKTMPEEINRILTDKLSSLCFAPVESAMESLKKEGLKDTSLLTGDIMVDSLAMGLAKADENAVLNKFELSVKDYYLLTLHRPYNVDESVSLKQMLEKLGGLKKELLFPVHPRTAKLLDHLKALIPPNIRTVEPVSFAESLVLQKNATACITDSGGMQKESYILGTPVFTLRTETEWKETIETGWNTLLAPALTPQNMISDTINSYQLPQNRPAIFGKAVAAAMVNHLLARF